MELSPQNLLDLIDAIAMAQERLLENLDKDAIFHYDASDIVDMVHKNDRLETLYKRIVAAYPETIA